MEIGGNGPNSAHPVIVVMGVASSGKSSVGRALAARCGFPFVEGDDLHPPQNIERMSRGLRLDDTHRQYWLERIAVAIVSAAPSQGLVLTCSALKRSYRDFLAAASPRVMFLHLSGARDLIEERMAHRTGHFMPLSLLDSQFEDLEPPGPDERVVTLDVASDPDALVERACRALAICHQPGGAA